MRVRGHGFTLAPFDATAGASGRGAGYKVNKMGKTVRGGAAAILGCWVNDITPGTLRADAQAGLLGALLVLPQGVAFAMLAGLPPEYGLYSAIVPCIVAALFGSSRHVLSGPTNANSLALFAVLAPLALPGSPGYIQMALAVTILVGVMQLAVGLLRLGSLANFISPSALFGFTSGAALLIAVHALKDALGLEGVQAHSAGAVLAAVGSRLGEAHWGASVVALTTIIVTLLVRHWDRRKPHMLAGLAAGTLLAAALNAGVFTAAGQPISVLGGLAQPWPPFHVPAVQWSVLPDLVGVAVPLTIVALAQSISIAKAVAMRSGQLIDANREFIGQGLSNVVGGLFSSYLSCGSLNRSVPNYEAGAAHADGGGVRGLAAGLAGAGQQPGSGADSARGHRRPADRGGLVAAGPAALARAGAHRAARGADRRGDAGGHRDDPHGDRHPAGHAAVADCLPVPHGAARHAPDGLRCRRSAAPFRGAGRAARRIAGMPPTETAAHGGVGVFRRGHACHRPPAGAARRGERRTAPPAGDEQEHELHRPCRRAGLGGRIAQAAGGRRRSVFPPAAPRGAARLAPLGLHRPPRRRPHLPRQGDRHTYHLRAAGSGDLPRLYGAHLYGVRPAGHGAPARRRARRMSRPAGPGPAAAGLAK
ncbi:inorganic anion transporter, SulP family [Bordetella pertussis STO1-CHOC-0017]|nr:inorganic anion transporter, SulP family [Bordetella pertussis STO1-CHOC-0017]